MSSKFKTRNLETRIFPGLTRIGPVLIKGGFKSRSGTTFWYPSPKLERPNPDLDLEIAIPRPNMKKSKARTNKSGIYRKVIRVFI